MVLYGAQEISYAIFSDGCKKYVQKHKNLQVLWSEFYC
jgi:hypothetical protein